MDNEEKILVQVVETNRIKQQIKNLLLKGQGLTLTEDLILGFTHKANEKFKDFKGAKDRDKIYRQADELADYLSKAVYGIEAQSLVDNLYNKIGGE